MIKYIVSAAFIITGISVIAQEPTDSIKTQELNEVVVEARNQRLGADVSTYIPTAKQKKRFSNSRRFIESYGYPPAEDFAK